VDIREVAAARTDAVTLPAAQGGRGAVNTKHIRPENRFGGVDRLPSRRRNGGGRPGRAGGAGSPEVTAVTLFGGGDAGR